MATSKKVVDVEDVIMEPSTQEDEPQEAELEPAFVSNMDESVIEKERAALLNLHEREVNLIWKEIALEYKLGRRKPPRIVSAPKGDIGRLKHMATTAYEKLHPNRATRWVYAPLANTTRSKLLFRKMVGYRPVTVEELGIEDASDVFGTENQPVRIMDMMLMSISKSKKEERAKERADKALEASEKPKKLYKEEMEKQGNVRGVRIVGDIKTEATWHERVKLPQKEG